MTSFIGKALWTWNTALPVPQVQLYSSGASTKTGLQPQDLQNFVGVPLQYYGNPPRPVDSETILSWIRYAEDTVEQDTGLLLCQTFVASPPAVNQAQAVAVNCGTQTASGYQVQGFDYDLADAAYDFIFPRAQDEGWMIYSLRYRPLQVVQFSPINPTAIRNASYIYPLLNQFFNVPNPWFVEDHDFGLIRFVPATNVQMLPLFAMQLSFMGFADSVPGGIWFQYTAGLTPNDYASRWSFVKQYVLAEAAIMGLNAVRGTINLGAEAYKMTVDGLAYETRYPKGGPYGDLIDSFKKMRDELKKRAFSRLAGPQFITF